MHKSRDIDNSQTKLIFPNDFPLLCQSAIVPGTRRRQKLAESEVEAKSPIVMFEFEQPASGCFQVGANQRIL